MKPKIIDFDEYIEKHADALVGKKNGIHALEALRNNGISFKELEKQFAPIIIKLPERIVTMNSSYFLGVWAERVQALGRKSFLEHYKFLTSDHILQKIDRHINTALLTASQEETLNA